MQLNITSKLKELSKNWIFWLIVITGIAIFLRSLPAWTNAAWGCDFGIYYGLTNSFVESGELFNQYSGWGSSYQYFPVLYAITGTAHWITGIDVITLMPKIAPIFGGLSILIFYFIVRELVGNKKIALLSSLILAVLPFHVYQTSHASPLTMGHFFMMLSMYFFIKYRQNVKFLIPLLISTMLLIMSHHLTTYFYLVSLIFIVFVENASKREWTPSVKKEVIYILTTSGLTFSYWAFIATPVYEGFMNIGVKIGAITIGSNIIISMFYVLFFSAFGIIWLKRRYNIFTTKGRQPAKSALVKFLLTLTICFTAMGIFSIIKLPWTNFSFTPLSIIYSIPLLVIFAFGVAGLRHTRFIKNGFFIRGWLLAIIISFLCGLVTNNGTILAHRHFEYLMVPLSIIAIYGIKNILLDFDYNAISTWKEKLFQFNLVKKARFLHKRQFLYMAVIIMLVTTNALSVYPSHVALNASYEVITDDNLSAIAWMDEHLEKNQSIIASDHRLARMAEAVGFNTTLDQAIVIWNTTDISYYINELYGVNNNYNKITHIIIDDIMKERMVHVGFGKIVYMTNETSQESYDKFLQLPFELIYRNATLNNQMKEVHWTEIYEVNWTYIEKLSLE